MTTPLDTHRLQQWALGFAAHAATLSKDPSTKVGSVIFDSKRRLVSTGYNGFARGVHDTPTRLRDRETKYKMTIHAETNAILFATSPLEGCTMVTTHPCCAHCAALVIQSGISHVMWPRPDLEFQQRWQDSLSLTYQQLTEAQVKVHEL